MPFFSKTRHEIWTVDIRHIDHTPAAGGAAGRLREVKIPRLFATRYHYSPRLRQFGWEDVLGEAGWLKAMSMKEYARRNPRQAGTPQDALFSHASALP